MQASLPALPPHLQSDTHLTAHLASRFHVSLPTAKLSSQALICLNTYTSSTRGPNGEKEGSAMAEAEEMARRAWTRLGSRAEDQAIVFLYVQAGPGVIGPTLTVQQRRVGFRKDDSQVTPPFILPLLFLHTTIIQTLLGRLCLRYINHDENYYDADRIEIWAVL